jgi:hypothetical protein
MSKAVTHENVPALEAVLLALSFNPEPVSTIAMRAGLSQEQTHAALQRLVQASLAIAEQDRFELTGPLSWFGNFAFAIKHYAPRNFLVCRSGETVSHLFLCDIRIKGGRAAGDPLNETAAVFACGKTAGDVQVSNDARATCQDCSRLVRIAEGLQKSVTA